MWRLSRAIYKMAEMASDVEARKLTYEGYDLMCMALDIQEDNYAVHKWMALFLNSKYSYEGSKALLKQLYNIKNHMLVSFLIFNSIMDINLQLKYTHIFYKYCKNI